jgi:Zn-dependent protease with chaperone function
MVLGLVLILPALYLGLAVAVGGFTVWFAATFFRPIMELGGVAGGFYFAAAKVALYLAPVFSGAILTFFLFKPLFASAPARAQPFALNPGSEPELFAFITGICALVQAPAPTRIDLDCEVNASAELGRGWRGLAQGDLVLTLGLPLVANLSVQEFAAVLAHEFGHFKQGAGMRISTLIWRINRWFYRVVYERDQWDDMLETAGMESESALTSFLVCCATVCIWFSRRVLSLFMYLSAMVSSTFIKQMERDADALQIQVAGSVCSENLIRKMPVLGLAAKHALQESRVQWNQSKRLPDNFPLLLRRHFRSVSPEKIEEINQTVGLKRSSVFQTHPSPGERIQQARLAAAPPIVTCPAPATDLFVNFAMPARYVTIFQYENLLGRAPGPEHLVEVIDPEFKALLDAQERGEALQRFFHGTFALLTPLPLPPVPSVINLNNSFDEVKNFPARVESVLDDLLVCDQELTDIEWRLKDCHEPAGICQAFHTLEECRARVQPIREAFAEHTVLALKLLNTPAVAAAIPKAADWRISAEQLVPAAKLLAETFSLWLQLRQHCYTLLLGADQNANCDGIAATLSALQSKLSAAHSLSNLPELQDLNKVTAQALTSALNDPEALEKIIQSWAQLNERVWGELAVIALRVRQIAKARGRGQAQVEETLSCPADYS